MSLPSRRQRHFQRLLPPAGQRDAGPSFQHRHPKHVRGQVCGHVHREGEAPASFVGCRCLKARCDTGSLFQEKSLAVLSGDRCHCGYPSPLFSLHEPENEDACLHRCQGEEFESCGNEEFFVVYQTQVQGNDQQLTPFHFLLSGFFPVQYFPVNQDMMHSSREASLEIPLRIATVSRAIKRLHPVWEFPPAESCIDYFR